MTRQWVVHNVSRNMGDLKEEEPTWKTMSNLKDLPRASSPEMLRLEDPRRTINGIGFVVCRMDLFRQF